MKNHVQQRAELDVGRSKSLRGDLLYYAQDQDQDPLFSRTVTKCADSRLHMEQFKMRMARSPNFHTDNLSPDLSAIYM